MKKTIVLIVCGLLLLAGSMNAYAASSRSYSMEDRAVIGFYEEAKPSEPDNPHPSTPDPNPSVPVSGGSNQKTGAQAPNVKTGISNIHIIASIVILLFTLALIIILRRKGKKHQSTQIISVLLCLGISLTLLFDVPSVHALGGNATAGGTVEFIEKVEPTGPTHPLKPDEPTPVIPYPSGPQGIGDNGLYLEIAPILDFGYNAISSLDQIYYAKAQYLTEENSGEVGFVPSYIEVTDQREESNGWKVSVKQLEQFSNDQTLHSTLEGAIITFRNGRISSANTDEDGITMADKPVQLTPGENSILMTAEEGYGRGKWYGLFGDESGLVQLNAQQKAAEENINVNMVDILFNPSITLDVPGKTAIDPVQYTCVLEWTLHDTP